MVKSTTCGPSYDYPGDENLVKLKECTRHPSVTDPVESLSSLGFWKKRHWVGQFPTGSAYFPVGFFSYAYLIQKWPVVENERFLLFFHYPLPRKWLLYSG